MRLMTVFGLDCCERLLRFNSNPKFMSKCFLRVQRFCDHRLSRYIFPTFPTLVPWVWSQPISGDDTGTRFGINQEPFWPLIAQIELLYIILLINFPTFPTLFIRKLS